MSPTYKAVGINLKAMPLGESDRLLTVLAREQGLIKLVAVGARQPNSKLGGRTALFVVNHLLIRPGRTLDKIAQCDLIYAYPRLSQHLTTLAAGQYLAEIILHLARQQQTQADLFDLCCQALQDLEQVQGRAVIETLLKSIWRILAWAGITPQWDASWLPEAVDQRNPDWRIGFNFGAGCLVPLTQPASSYFSRNSQEFALLSAGEFQILAWIAGTTELGHLPTGEQRPTQPLAAWLGVERLLRQYMQFHLEHPLKAASLLDSCFSPIPAAT